MGPFESMTNVSIYTAITVIILLVLALRTNPIKIIFHFVLSFFSNFKNSLYLLAVLVILFLNKLELSVEQSMNYQADFTQSFYQIEGKFVETVQHFFNNDILTYITSYFYVIVFTCLMIVSIVIYIYHRNYQLFYALCYAVLINYIVAIPFYLFFPITEVWHTQSNVNLLIHNVFPTFEQEYRLMSGLDNCFPSLHTSLSVTMAVIAVRSNNKFWQYFTALTAVIIIFSIFYLGIHWLIDMSAGLLLGVAASIIGLRISERASIHGSNKTTINPLANPQNISK